MSTNVIHSSGEYADMALDFSGTTYINVGKYADSYFQCEDGKLIVVVKTSNGDGNFNCMKSRCKVLDTACRGCVVTKAKEFYPNFIRYEDGGCYYLKGKCYFKYINMYFNIVPEFENEVKIFTQIYFDILGHISFKEKIDTVLSLIKKCIDAKPSVYELSLKQKNEI